MDIEEISSYKIFSSENVVSKQDSSLVLVVKTLAMDKELNSFVKRILDMRNHTVVYVLSQDHSFDDSSVLWEMKNNSTARIVHCDELLCDSLVYSLLEYESQDYVSILLWNLLMSMNDNEKSVVFSQLLSDLSLPQASSSFVTITRGIQNRSYFALYTMVRFRSVVSHPCFVTSYRVFNPIVRLSRFMNKKDSLNCTIRKSSEYNNHSAVLLTIYKRDYLSQILPLICSQTLPPSVILIIQNEVHLTLKQFEIPKECSDHSIQVYHIWLSNWNSYSFMRHFVPVPSWIHSTILVDDDMFLVPNAFEKGLSVMRENQCIATERGRIIDSNSKGQTEWPLVIGKEIKEISFVDYAFIPLFMDTEWRKSVYVISPFSRVYGDILFVSLSIYHDRRIPSCVIPGFDFFLRNEDGDSNSTSKKNPNLYNYHYNRIAEKWIHNGYVPIQQRIKNHLYTVYLTNNNKHTNTVNNHPYQGWTCTHY